jgi:ligand-binding SRPBCC domain-containing protein
MRIRTFTTEQWLPRPPEEVFGFFSNAANLDRLTPSWLHFRILTPLPILMQQGTIIEYRLRWRGWPLDWKTQIAFWDPPARFIDRALRSPYRQWLHEHTFEAHEGGTWMRDRVDYAVPGGIIEPLVSRWLVTPDVERIFAYRREKMREMFGG